MRKRLLNLLIILASIAGALARGQPLYAAPAAPGARPQVNVNLAALARQKFTQKKYDEAIDLYRKHLRRAPRDFNAWNQLGASYYHTGQPKKALRYLKHVERKTIDKSYNYYYQGLCYTAAEQPGKAKEYFAFAASRFQDEYGSRATFEMAAIEYKAKNKNRATYWLTLYMQRFPQGVYRPQTQRMLQSLQQGVWLEGVEGVEKPDMERALYRYNSLSLMQYPHYWYLQGGFRTDEITGQEPAGANGGLKANGRRDMAATLNSGIGLGPWRDGPMTAFGGYTYRQTWITDEDRINEYADSPGDFEYFPLRGDLLERRHQFYGDFRRDFAKIFYVGFFLRWEFARIGSTVFPSPDDSELRKVLKISDTMNLIPWVGASFIENMRTLFYVYLRKEVNEDAPDTSNKSYDFGTNGGTPAISLGLSHDIDFPEIPLSLGIELFRYEFIYNDFWLDYERLGGIFNIEHELLPRWFIEASVGYYQDSYILQRFKQKQCSSDLVGLPVGGTAPPSADTGDAAEPTVTKCWRDDTGLLYSAGVYWNWTQFQRFALTLQVTENHNAEQKEFETSKQTIAASFTMAFPSVKRVVRYVDRYADSAFTKEPD